jgi:hypothetical protein
MADITDKLIKQSNGTQPLPTTLSAQKNSGATTASLNAATGWDTTTAKHIRMYKTKVVNGQTVPDWDYVCFYKGTLSGTTLSNLTLVWSSTGTDQTFGIGDTVDLSYTSGWGEDLYSALTAHLDQDGTLKADSVDVTAVIKDSIITPAKLDSTFKQGWFSGELPAVSSVTHNGNRSYDVVFASTVASTLTPGMRLELTKTVAGNGYMGGAFNGSSHYFTKTSPSGTLGTVTNNFTIEAVVQPTSYQAGWVAARCDAAGANGFGLQMNASGQLSAVVYNGGSGNYRFILSYQSLPLNKKSHVAASWTGGTVVIYIDGVSIPVQAAGTAGTAPTTAGTGGDFSIGRKGAAAEYFPGYISNVAVFDAVLSAATIRQHATYKLTGSETNCIGAWSLDNTPNDQSAAGNNLTATGGVGFTAQTPHGQLDSGVQTTKAVGLVMNVSTSTVTVQVPEGVTIPTAITITQVAYSTQANPFGWVSDKGRWEVIAKWLISSSQSTPTANTYYNVNSRKLNIPKGSWGLIHSGRSSVTAGGGVAPTLAGGLSLGTSTAPVDSALAFYSSVGVANIYICIQFFNKNVFPVVLSAATDYYAVVNSIGASSTAVTIDGADIIAIPSGL